MLLEVAQHHIRLHAATLALALRLHDSRRTAWKELPPAGVSGESAAVEAAARAACEGKDARAVVEVAAEAVGQAAREVAEVEDATGKAAEEEAEAARTEAETTAAEATSTQPEAAASAEVTELETTVKAPTPKPGGEAAGWTLQPSTPARYTAGGFLTPGTAVMSSVCLSCTIRAT